MKEKLPRGIVQACAGIVADCETEPYLNAVELAEHVVGQNYTDAPQAQVNRRYLVEMVKANLVNRKQGSREMLNRRYGLCISERTLREEKMRFCYELARQTRLIEAEDDELSK